MTLRPGFTVAVDTSQRNGATADVLTVRNATSNLATDTSITLTTEHHRLIGSAYDLRIPGTSPDDEDIEGRPEVSFTIPHTLMEELGKKFTLLITIRFSDRYFLRRWEQRVTVSYHEGDFFGRVAKYWTDPVGTEIKPYRKRLMPVRFPWQIDRSSSRGHASRRRSAENGNGQSASAVDSPHRRRRNLDTHPSAPVDGLVDKAADRQVR